LSNLRVLFRVDVNSSLGLGHIMRCLVLADLLRSRGHMCAFLSLDSDIDVRGILKSRGFNARDLIGQSRFGSKIFPEKNKEFEDSNYRCIADGLEYRPHILVIDHYWIGHEWESRFKDRGVKILVLDDFAQSSHDCDFLVHQTNVVSRASYLNLTPPGTELMVGFQYMILRADLHKVRIRLEKLPLKGRNILVAFGLADPNNVTGTIGRILSELEFETALKITILAGNPSILRIAEQHLSSQSANQVSISLMTSALDIIQIMRDTDYAIVAGGLMSIELAYLGIPCTVIPSNKVQDDVAKEIAQRVNNNVLGKSWTKNEVARHLNATLVQQKAGYQRIFHPEVDGLGAVRIIERVLGAI
jgi:UDP-2,4-diacetamido-2,4,6-trideoxy-beta-L-altropyranose hydrolase